MFKMYASNSHSYTHLILALGIVREPTLWGFITSNILEPTLWGFITSNLLEPTLWGFITSNILAYMTLAGLPEGHRLQLAGQGVGAVPLRVLCELAGDLRLDLAVNLGARGGNDQIKLLKFRTDIAQ